MPELGEKDRRALILSWVVISGLVLIMLVRGLGSYWTIGNNPRRWDYLTVPYVPAQTYSSSRPTPISPAEQVPEQVQLPPAAGSPKKK